MSYQKRTGCLCANSHPGSYTTQDAYSDLLIVDEILSDGSLRSISRSAEREREYSSSLTAHLSKDVKDIVMDDSRKKKLTVRRLTPLECCRLMGFPDDWTEGVPGSESAQYKMWGNGCALPCVLFVEQGIKEVLLREMGEEA